MRAPRHFTTAGLFAGIGGIELGLQRAGHSCQLLCENDPSAVAVLESTREFADVPLHCDVTTLEGLPKGVELLAGGFPCQDLSQAGQTAGIAGAKSGLVGEVFRLLRKQRVPYLLLENVPFMLHLGRGRALEVIVSALEELHYHWAYRVVDAMAFGLPQRRLRVFLVAVAAELGEDPRDIVLADGVEPSPLEEDWPANPCGFYWTEGLKGLGWAVDAVPTLKGGSAVGIPSPPAILLPPQPGRPQIVTPGIAVAERLQGFRKNFTRPAAAVARSSLRWRLVGNAVNVKVATWLGKRFARPGRFQETASKPHKRGQAWPRVAWSVGDGRFIGNASSWPVKYKRMPLLELLGQDFEPLSAGASEGLLKRLDRSNLSKAKVLRKPLAEHLAQMKSALA